MTDIPTLAKARMAYLEAPSLDTADVLIEALTDRMRALRDQRRNEQASDAAVLKLAHTGMALEIGGHELYDIDMSFRSAVSKLPKDIRAGEVGEKLSSTFEQLIGAFRTLSPMRPSRTSQMWMTGEEISEPLRSFRAGDPVRFSDDFLRMRLFTRSSDIMPVMINLVRNARYWATRSDGPPDILVDLKGGSIIVSDNGPGIPESDRPFIFDPLFSNRVGGTGVGLFLVKARVEAMIGSIRYIEDDAEKLLPGANFELKIPGLETTPG